MPNYKSPLGSKQFAGQPMREFDVPDETEQQYPDMNVAMRQRGPAMHGTQPQMPPDMDAINAFQNRLGGGDESYEDSAQIEREIRAAKEARRTGRERVNEGAKRRIEMLVGMIRTTRQVELDGNLYVLQTLRSKEIRESIMAAANFDGSVQFPFEMRKQYLARSLIHVAGVDIEQFVGSNSLEAKLDLIDDLPEAILLRLYQEYSILVTESTEKYAIKSDAEAQEVAEDLKK
jgi:hypothetical protein